MGEIFGCVVARRRFLLQPLSRAGEGQRLSSKNEFHSVYFHKVGTPQSSDVLVYEDKANPQRFHNVYTTEDQRFLFLSVSNEAKGKNGNALL